MTKFNEQDWLKYRTENPEMRFWQALQNYMGVGYIFIANTDGEIKDRQMLQDTFYLGDN